MDINHGPGRVPPSSATQPLRIHKQHSPLRTSQSQHLNNDNYQPKSISTNYPPRTSSLLRDNDRNASSRANPREKSHGRQNSNNSSIGRLTQSSAACTSISDPLIRGSRSVPRSPISSYHSGSSEIIGNFIPVDTVNMNLPSVEEHLAGYPKTASGMSKTRRVINPYEFEPGTPYGAEDARQTTISDFIGNGNEVPSPEMRGAHMKNSRSEGNTIYMAQKQTSLNLPQSRPDGHTIHRSESSPRLNPHRSPERDSRSPSPDITAYYAEDEAAASPTRRGRSRSRIVVGRDWPHQNSPSRQFLVDRSTAQDFCSPTHITFQNHNNRSPPKLSSPGRHLTRSPTRVLDDVPERDEFDSKINDADLFVGPEPNGPKKRSRSPLKKMFGEHGWLGRSPDESQAGKLSFKNSAPGRKEKTSVMGKLRTKIEELAEKADLSPTSRGSRDKHPKLSVLSVSLGPPEQARIYMEVELMIVHTANNFLMTQFSQGRMAMDSIKKTVDTWKTRGRPTVLEFMYDQATQRDLIAVNQQNLRFYGERADDSVRINAMLYNWKQVASFMAIRTFCDADTVILKLLFDVEQILELLGARDPILARLQQIRATSNETMRVARAKD